MILYDLLVGEYESLIPKKGYIWTADGVFISPSSFKDSGKIVYGYMLTEHKAVKIRRSNVRRSWSGPHGFEFLSNSGARSMSDGVANSKILESISEFSRLNCPAVYEALTQFSMSFRSYMPAIDELCMLYDSIMHGRMKEDLIKAGIYELCNYREAKNSTDGTGWNRIWSSTEVTNVGGWYNQSWCVDFRGSNVREYKHEGFNYIIPFFDL